MNSLFYELGLITREDWDELDLRVAQLEHRVRLIEEPPRRRRSRGDAAVTAGPAATLSGTEGNPAFQ